MDPPYNTEAANSDGNSVANDSLKINNNKFIYRDKFSRNGWLNMMNERLILAKELLKDDGVIFVSIDDSEQAYLKVLMDDIFGEENFVANIVWEKKNSGSASDSKLLKILTEYVLVYAKNINKIFLNEEGQNVDKNSNYKFEDKHVRERGKYFLNQLDRASLTWSSGLDYVIEHNDKKYYPGKSQEDWLRRQSGKHAVKDWQWRWSASKVQWGIENDFILFKNDSVYSKQYQFVDNEGNQIVRTSKFSNLISKIHNTLGTQTQKEIFNAKIFDHPKPTQLLKYLINLIPNKNARVLDFFAGSGTTGHAVMELNREDGGNRTYTLITNNENKIGDEITYERLYRINHGKGTKNESFKWAEKHLPYLSNLNVFKVKK
ncbi:site-specific DNA-methyltransferase, partial [Ureaplasma zalophigenitalium]|nr:site-specific DNA-methyltransferase [Ureaplasma zalophigenitalium]